MVLVSLKLERALQRAIQAASMIQSGSLSFFYILPFKLIFIQIQGLCQKSDELRHQQSPPTYHALLSKSLKTPLYGH
jgi:hypothetical protein